MRARRSEEEEREEVEEEEAGGRGNLAHSARGAGALPRAARREQLAATRIVASASGALSSPCERVAPAAASEIGHGPGEAGQSAAELYGKGRERGIEGSIHHPQNQTQSNADLL